MAFSSGTFSLYTPGNPVVTGTTISSDWSNNTLNDIATGLSTCVLKDGSQTITANIPMSGFTLTGIAAADANGEPVRWQQSSAGVMSATGDFVYASAANTPARLPAAATVAAHATTCDPWGARVVTLSGSAVTFTDLADADYVGQRVLLLMNAAHIWTDGAVFDVQGGATYTTAAGDWVELVATAVDAFDVTIFPANGGVVASKGRAPITLGTMVAASGQTAIDFTGIPAGTKRITINPAGLSLSGTDNFLIQIGDAGGPETGSYVSNSVSVADAAASVGVTSTSGFIISVASAAATISGSMTLNLVDAATFLWSANHTVGSGGTASGAGQKALSAELTQVRITRTGTDTIDAGSVNISYE